MVAALSAGTCLAKSRFEHAHSGPSPLRRFSRFPPLSVLESPDADLAERWTRLQRWVQRRFGKDPDLEGILFLIGMQELGKGFIPDLDKKRKEQIVWEGTYNALAALGYYERAGLETNGHWIWEECNPLPETQSSQADEQLVRQGILRYFDQNIDDWSNEA